MNKTYDKDFNFAKGKNVEGYADPTAIDAINNIMNEKEVHRGEIYFIKEPNYENGRPAIIVSSDERNRKSPSVSVVYLSGKNTDATAHHVAVMAKCPSTALCETVSKVHKVNVDAYIRTCTADEMERVDKGLACVLGLNVDSSAERCRGAAQNDAEEQRRNNSSDSAELVAAISERDVYKKLYNELLAKMLER